MLDVELLYRQQLTDADRRLLRATARADGPIAAALESPELAAAVYGDPHAAGVAPSPLQRARPVAPCRLAGGGGAGGTGGRVPPAR